MVQSLTRYCPRCGTSVPATQMVCQNCGAPTDAKMVKVANQPTSAVIPPPPPPDSLAPPQTVYSQQVSPQPLQAAQPLPAYARPQKNSSGLRRIGFGAVLLLLLVVVLIGTGGFFAVRYLGSHLPGGDGHPYLNTPGEQAPTTTTPLNTTVTYASVVITIVNAQQATSFANDNGAPGLLRLNLHEHNINTPEKSLIISTVSYTYTDAFHLILPGGKSVASIDSQLVKGPVQGESQSDWVDFPVSTTLKVSSLVLRLGTDTEAQMDIPLTGHPALSQYQSRQVSVGKQVHYGNLLVTLSTATAQFSYGGQQADKGMRFLVVALSVANPTSSDVIANPTDYIRLQVGGTVASPQGNTTLPTSFSANTTGTTGEAVFLVPQNETAFTLVLPTNDSVGATSQAAIAFQMS